MQALILRLQADVEARKQSRLDISATARVALMAGVQLIASLGGTVLFERLGATTTVLGSGLFILGIGVAGSIYFGRMFVPPAEPPASS